MWVLNFRINYFQTSNILWESQNIKFDFDCKHLLYNMGHNYVDILIYRDGLMGRRSTINHTREVFAPLSFSNDLIIAL